MLRVYLDGELVREEPSVKPTDHIRLDSGRFIVGVEIPEGREAKIVRYRRGKRVLRVDIKTVAGTI